MLNYQRVIPARWVELFHSETMDWSCYWWKKSKNPAPPWMVHATGAQAFLHPLYDIVAPKRIAGTWSKCWQARRLSYLLGHPEAPCFGSLKIIPVLQTTHTVCAPGCGHLCVCVFSCLSAILEYQPYYFCGALFSHKSKIFKNYIKSSEEHISYMFLLPFLWPTSR